MDKVPITSPCSMAENNCVAKNALGGKQMILSENSHLQFRRAICYFHLIVWMNISVVTSMHYNKTGQLLTTYNILNLACNIHGSQYVWWQLCTEIDCKLDRESNKP